jgi:hypothetical protein
VVGWGSGVRGIVGMELAKNTGCDFKAKALRLRGVLTYWIWILIRRVKRVNVPCGTTWHLAEPT